MEAESHGRSACPGIGRLTSTAVPRRGRPRTWVEAKDVCDETSPGSCSDDPKEEVNGAVGVGKSPAHVDWHVVSVNPQSAARILNSEVGGEVRVCHLHSDQYAGDETCEKQAGSVTTVQLLDCDGHRHVAWGAAASAAGYTGRASSGKLIPLW